ncbi:hypothetical protein SLEP1_g57974 [Rubroshorea leprosula]|uniref:Disease resistance protein RGA3 n=1 Tax=Rubroshorea leprosula TaxID=152421 RepID=A0AAV5MN84_9ROSI|nr:hypothetical protein SLEP1_g57974 [Rubroshorea leprosula]
MAEALVSALLQQLKTIIYEEGKREVKLVTGVGKEIKRLEENLESIQALLDDAEERQMKDKSIKIWLERLKEVSYDMEDVLDEWNTALLKSQLYEADQNIFSLFVGKVCHLCLSCFCCGQVVHRRGIALKIKDINERLDEIAKAKDRYQLTSREVRQPRRVESTSFTEESKLHGRDEVKKDLVDSLLCGNSDERENDVRTISIVGMGGIGKTSLAQLVYNDETVMAHFNKKIWVCVSEVFDLSKVAKAIIIGLAEPKKDSKQIDPDSAPLQNLLEEICKSIEGKKFFLVLDDVWTDGSESWESLNQAFKHAAPGSRILVTTRKDTVADTMKSFRVFHLEQLSEDVCWKILCQEAFVGRGEEQCKNFEDIGKNIAKECSGLPLAAKTIGCMLRFKKTKEEWTIILNSEIWKLELEGIFAPLLLSYLDLPSAVRRCFSYCSTFRKGVKIGRKSLIRQWMAQGYLNFSENPEMEIVGDEYFDCLVARSFFQDFLKLEDGSIRGSWESFNQAFKPAAPGSRILVTTRNDRVAMTMKSFRDFPLEQLSENVCWKILNQEAFVGWGDEQCKNLEDIGKNIAKKCSGLPLAAKTLGSMLRSKKTREGWTNILNSEIWELDLEAVFAPLLLSYFDLPSAVRRCFLYCSTFPKGIEINRDVLIYQWMAQGYLNSSQNPEMEITGVDYFECLAARSFFQDFQKLEDGSIRACRIHDIVLDFARFLMGDGEFVVKEVHPEDNLRIKLSSEKTHHLLVILAENAGLPTSLVGAEKLQSLSIFGSDYAVGGETGNSLIQPKHLRSLIVCGVKIEGLPEEVGKLMHLKLLDLSGSQLGRLPKAICRLFNLQSLILRKCSLKRLPDGIEKLVNLRYLDTTDCFLLTYCPKGIGRLTSLRELVGIVVSCDHNDDKEFSLGDLENLCHLRILALIVERQQIDANEVRRATLQSKIHLKKLNLDGPWKSRTEEDYVINVLSPPSHTNVTFSGNFYLRSLKQLVFVSLKLR